MKKVNPKAKPFYFKGKTDNALLFLHGFTASPSELLPTAELLHEINGCTVSGILLPGHGTHPADLNTTTWQDWYEAVQEEGEKLLERYPHVFVAGLSMGGLLSLHAGIHLQGLNGVVAINAPVFTQYRLLSAAAPLMQHMLPYFTKGARKDDELARKGRFDYNCYPVRAYTSLTQLRNTIIKELEELRLPSMLVQSLRDRAVRSGSVEYIKDHLPNSRVKMVTLPKSGHIATMDEEKNILVHELVEFMESESKIDNRGI
ncbi:putative esterase/lipase [hydrocarbon metagenome]|uniref:Putative esterase/lipase n=1 Tax=hydrocarbon metagenome TaxID=938273 RepID=A0A0W8E5T7_9ZZZZ